MSPVRATVLQLSLDLQLRTPQLSRYARSKRSHCAVPATGRLTVPGSHWPGPGPVMPMDRKVVVTFPQLCLAGPSMGA